MNSSTLSRVIALSWRYALMLPRDSARYFDMFYWPLMDVMLWSFTGRWMQQSEAATSLGLLFILAPFYWQIFSRITLEIPRNMLEEIWGGSVFNLAATPLKPSEWLLSLVVVAFMSQLVTTAFLAVAAALFYDCNVFMLGWILVPLLIPLVIFSIALGIFSAGLIVYKGSRIGTITWAIPWLLAPISGIYYPLDVLPSSLYFFGIIFPPAHIFTALRHYVFSGELVWSHLYYAWLSAVIFLPLALSFFFWMYEKSRRLGLARLTRL